MFKSEGTAQPGSPLDSIYWNIGDDLQSMLVIQNAGDSSVEAQATLSYDTSDGRHEKYKLPLLLVPAKATRTINLKSIIASGLPDQTGKVISLGTTFGTVTIEPASGEQSDSLIGGSFTFDPDAGTCGGDILPICSPEPGEAVLVRHHSDHYWSLRAALWGRAARAISLQRRLCHRGHHPECRRG